MMRCCKTLVHLLRIRMECKSAEQTAGELTLAAYQEPICNRAPVDTPPLSTTPSGRMMDSLAETIRYMIHLSRPFCRRLGLLACLLFALAACGAPVKVDRVGLRTAYDDLNRTALSSDQLSEATRTVLRRAALLEVFDSRPDDAITALRAQAIATGMHWPDLYALAELNYYEGRRTKSKAMLLASALYAYAVLFPTGDTDRPSPYAGEFLHAADFYNLALTQVLSGAGAEGVATGSQGGRICVRDHLRLHDVANDSAAMALPIRAACPHRVSRRRGNHAGRDPGDEDQHHSLLPPLRGGPS